MSSKRYAAAGVDYGLLDAFKRSALEGAAATLGLLEGRGATVAAGGEGAPAFVFTLGGQTLALVVEGLGTKGLIAAAVESWLGPQVYASVAYDAVAAVVGDLCAVGALPLALNAYFATGSSAWYVNGRGEALVAGWREGCEAAGCAWGGGESPALSDLIAPDSIELAGGAVGVVPEGVEPLFGQLLEAGDEIVLVASSGLHANGASLARDVAKALPEGYRTRLDGGVTLGEALLARSLIYAPLVERLLAEGPLPTYLAHITGHGLLKLMRPRRELTHRLFRLPPVPEVLGFLVERSGLAPREAYATLNMGAGFAVYVRPGGGPRVVELADQLGFAAEVAGVVERGSRAVVLEPLGIRYLGEELQLAPGGDGSPREPVI